MHACVRATIRGRSATVCAADRARVMSAHRTARKDDPGETTITLYSKITAAPEKKLCRSCPTLARSRLEWHASRWSNNERGRPCERPPVCWRSSWRTHACSSWPYLRSGRGRATATGPWRSSSSRASIPAAASPGSPASSKPPAGPHTVHNPHRALTVPLPTGALLILCTMYVAPHRHPHVPFAVCLPHVRFLGHTHSQTRSHAVHSHTTYTLLPHRAPPLGDC